MRLTLLTIPFFSNVSRYPLASIARSLIVSHPTFQIEAILSSLVNPNHQSPLVPLEYPRALFLDLSYILCSSLMYLTSPPFTKCTNSKMLMTSSFHHSLTIQLRHLHCLHQTAHTSLYSWFSYNSLALNPDKSDAILLGTSKHSASLTHIAGINIAGTKITLSNHLKLLGVTLDSNLNLNKHVSSICRSSYFHLRALCHIRHAINDDIAKSIGQALVSSRLDYASGILYGISQLNINKLLQNKAGNGYPRIGYPLVEAGTDSQITRISGSNFRI